MMELWMMKELYYSRKDVDKTLWNGEIILFWKKLTEIFHLQYHKKYSIEETKNILFTRCETLIKMSTWKNL